MTPATSSPAARSSWRDRYQVHPCAEIFPMMTEAELDALAQDIKLSGIRELPITWTIGGITYLIDGRNRCEALDRLGQTITTVELAIDNPAAFVISKNIQRR